LADILCIAIVENLTEVRPEACVDAGQQGVIQWLLKRIRVSSILCILPYQVCILAEFN